MWVYNLGLSVSVLQQWQLSFSLYFCSELKPCNAKLAISGEVISKILGISGSLYELIVLQK